MADFFKGLAGGFGTGLQFGQQLRQRRMEDDLAQAYAKPETSQGYTAETGQQLEELAKTGAYDIVPQYAPAAEGQTQGVFTGYQAVPKAGLDLQGDMPAAPMSFNPQQVQDYGGRRVAGQFDPTQLRGLQMQEAARVLGSYGDAKGAAALETQADELRRGLARDKREESAEADRVARRPLEIKQLENALVSQGLTIAEAQRVAAEQVSISSAREKLQTLRKDGPLTAAIISNVAGEFKLDPTKFLQAEDAVNTLEIKDLKRNLSSAALKGEDGLNKFLADKFDPDKTDNIKPMITKAKDGSFVVTYGDQVLQEYGAHKNMMSLVGGVINMIDQNPFATLTTLSTLDTQAAARKASEAAVRASDATVGLKNTQMKMFTDQAAGNAEAQQIRAKFTALTPEEQVGPKGQGLMRDFNMANAKAGMAVPLGAAPRAERPALSEAEITSRAEKYVSTRQKNPDTGKIYTLDEAIEKVRGTPPAPGTPAAARASLDAVLGGGDPFVPPPAAARPTVTPPAPAPAPAPRQTGSMGVDTSRPRTDVNPVTNLPRGAPVSAPNLVDAAARGLDAGQARYVAYLEAKIAARERLTPDEAVRAKRFGLVP